ncbi:uncharacterized protein LOC143446830 isoform X1 [Clavelina lepadiformis]|uniref:uncharacterized protein LOC143446830 isoform X1 n=1 Tax=Clavelina lepadiformis TaxID=159417 RepID=UPI0040429631
MTDSELSLSEEEYKAIALFIIVVLVLVVLFFIVKSVRKNSNEVASSTRSLTVEYRDGPAKLEASGGEESPVVRQRRGRPDKASNRSVNISGDSAGSISLGDNNSGGNVTNNHK